jgi:hypothetical protein
MAKRKTLADVWELISIKGDDDCWEWQGCKNSTGYGSMTASQKTYSAHRIVFCLTYPNLISLQRQVTKNQNNLFCTNVITDFAVIHCI